MLTALFLPLFWVLMDSGYLNDAGWIAEKAWLVLGVWAVAALILALGGKLDWERAAGLLILCGLTLRISYALGTHSYIRHHDYGDIWWFVYGHTEELGVHDYGHAPYILYLYLNRSLADFNVGQFYHPPLFHILSALAMRVTYKIVKTEDLIYLFEASKIISCLASCYTLLLTPKICRALGIRQMGKCLSVGVMAFLPMFFLMAGWVNNDGLVLFFMVWIVLYTIRWYQNPAWGNTLLLALGFGLGMMSKMSCALLAFFTGAVMLLRFLRTVEKGRQRMTAEKNSGQKGSAPEKRSARLASVIPGSLLLKFPGFLLVAAPLGLAYPIRNYVKFGQAFNYVLELNIPQVPVKDFAARFLAFPFGRLSDPVFLDAQEYNLNLFLLKTASFGEFAYSEELAPWGIAIVTANMLLILLALAAVVLVWRFTKEFFWRWAMPGLWLLLYGSAVVFAWKYPYPCSMDARYVALTVLMGALYLGKAVQYGVLYLRKTAWQKRVCMPGGKKADGTEIAKEAVKRTGKGIAVWLWRAYGLLCLASLAVLSVAGGYFFLHL